MSKYLIYKYAVYIFIVMFSFTLIGHYVYKYLAEQKKYEIEKSMDQISLSVTTHIQEQINGMTSGTRILESLLKNSRYNTGNFEQWASDISGIFPYLTSVQFARNGIVSHIYPFEAHKGALGHDLLKDKRRDKGASAAIISRKLTFVGPIKLIQNQKFAVIARLPIFQVHARGENFWGFSTTIAYTEDLLKNTLDEIDAAGFHYRLLGDNHDASKRPVFANTIMEDSPYQQSFEVSVPNGIWHIILQPKEAPKLYAWEIHLFFIGIGLIISFMLLRYEKRLHSLFKQQNDTLLRYRHLMDSASDGIHVLDTEGNVVDCGLAFADMLGYTYEEACKLNVTQWDVHFDPNEMIPTIHHLLEKPELFETKHKRKDGTVFDVQINAKGIDLEGKQYLYASARDITEVIGLRKELEVLNAGLEQRVREEIQKNKTQEHLLIQQSKMAAMGEMIGAISHQFKQPINVIGVLAQTLQDIYDHNEMTKEDLDRTVRDTMLQVQYMNQTINDFRNFFRPDKEKMLFRPCETVQDIAGMMKDQLIRGNLEVIIHPHEHFHTFGFENELKQVVLVILNNAKDVISGKAIPHGTVDCFFETRENTGIIKMRDNGGGIPDELLPDKIFESHFTTKGDQGTGIGLSIGKIIIEENMGGKFWAQNVEGGAEFVIELPLATP